MRPSILASRSAAYVPVAYTKTVTISSASSLSVSKPVTASSIWSASDATYGSMTLSNGNRTVTPSVNGTWLTVRGTIARSTGKAYVEFLLGTEGIVFLGAASSSFDITAGTFVGNQNFSIGYYLSGDHSLRVSMGSGSSNNYGVNTDAAPNDVWALAIDLDAGKGWIAQNNSWFGSGNPGTGSTPSFTYVPANAAPLLPALSFSSAAVWSLQPVAADQTYAPPTGFSAWG